VSPASTDTAVDAAVVAPFCPRWRIKSRYLSKVIALCESIEMSYEQSSFRQPTSAFEGLDARLPWAEIEQIVHLDPAGRGLASFRREGAPLDAGQLRFFSRRNRLVVRPKGDWAWRMKRNYP
jgi:hypothetical protein